ncbi:hypothetical protein [Chryseobacterium sp. 18068]|uniref:hypothetical protein n=1 Tax=Chryseobacterium sp. 18068 TaxID=2681414 RepID=UPI001359D17C|nr:hypothetical protein [Chryseobacterium sp. 18068]
MEHFEFNNLGVCLNPNKYVILKRDNFALDYLTITTHFKDGMWKGGFRVNFNRFGASMCSSKEYENEKSCYHQQKESALEYIYKNVRRNPEKKLYDEIKTGFIHFPETLQLCLF